MCLKRLGWPWIVTSWGSAHPFERDIVYRLQLPSGQVVRLKPKKTTYDVGECYKYIVESAAAIYYERQRTHK